MRQFSRLQNTENADEAPSPWAVASGPGVVSTSPYSPRAMPSPVFHALASAQAADVAGAVSHGHALVVLVAEVARAGVAPVVVVGLGDRLRRGVLTGGDGTGPELRRSPDRW